MKSRPFRGSEARTWICADVQEAWRGFNITHGGTCGKRCTGFASGSVIPLPDGFRCL